MPLIGIPAEDLRERIGRPVDREDLLRILQEVGCDVDGYELLNRARCARCGWVMEIVGKEEVPPRCDRCDADLRSSPEALQAMDPLEVVRMDLLAVRPDLFDPGGLARALRGILGVESGLAAYQTGPTALRLRVDPSVARPSSSRPFIGCAVLENVNLDENRIKILMKLQENLHWALGRDRKHASIGVYDLDALGLGEGGGSKAGGATAGKGGQAAGKEFDLEYTTEDPEKYRFVPLGSPGTGAEHERSLRQILEEHPKGVAYARLLAGFDRYPILRTVAGRVLSMPPIINSEQTKVHQGSKRLFIDVTGTGQRVVHRTLNILVTSLLELDHGARLRAVEIVGSEGTTLTPDLSPQAAWCELEHAVRLLGIPLTLPELKELLLRMRHGILEEKDGKLKVAVPAYRNDILHEHDLIEDAAIAYGYGRITRSLVPTMTIGHELPIERRSELAREILIGLGLTEIMTLVLTAPESSDRLLDLPDHPATVLVENPISGEQVQLRTSLLPGILDTLARNRHNPLPQGIFEVGDVTFLDPAAETGAWERRHLAFGVTSPKLGFADLRPLAEAVVREFGWPFTVEPWDPPFLLEGRGARILAPGGATVGIMGEVHPAVLERLGLQNPAVVLEMTLSAGDEPEPYRSIA